MQQAIIKIREKISIPRPLQGSCLPSELRELSIEIPLEASSLEEVIHRADPIIDEVEHLFPYLSCQIDYGG